MALAHRLVPFPRPRPPGRALEPRRNWFKRVAQLSCPVNLPPTHADYMLACPCLLMDESEAGKGQQAAGSCCEGKGWTGC